MGRGTWAVMVVSGLLVLGACGDDDSDGTGADGGSDKAGQGASGGSSGGSSGSTSSGSSGKGGSSGSTGTGTNAGNGGSAGGSAGSGGSAAGSGDAGSGGNGAMCDLACGPNERCELVPVQCIRAPCPAQPMCVEASANAGSGGAGSGGSGGSGKACGSRGLGECADGEFCQFPMGADCGRADAPGTCAEQPMICTREYVPVCGCDGTTYSNKCEASAAGVSVETEGECGGSSSAGGTRCVGTVTCHQVPTKCADLQVHTIENGCYGPCVSIDECACSGPEDCPDENQYTCHMSAMHCGPYV